MTRVACSLALVAVLTLPVHADTVHNVATALDYAGFDARGSWNPLSGGYDLLINRQFTGNVFDFGAPELALQGPVSLQASTGGRIVPGFDVSLTTAINDRNQAVPLNYNYTSGLGAQTRTVNGSVLVDASLSINALGFYAIDVTSSKRSTITREGVNAGTDTIDSDIGPLSISGNVFADALAAITDPFFEQAGKTNPFEAFSRRVGELHSDRLAQMASASETSAGMVVPEPPVLAMLLVGGPALLWAARRSR